MKTFLITCFIIFFLMIGCAGPNKKDITELPLVETTISIVDDTTASSIEDSEAKLKILHKSNMYRMLNYVSIVSLVGLVGCSAMAIILSSKAGLIGSIASGACFAISLAATEYMKFIALGGLIGFGALFIYIIYILAKNKIALKELVLSIQTGKDTIVNKDYFKKQMDSIQSKSTKNIVIKEKSRLKI